MSAKVLKKEFEINVGCLDSFLRIFVGLSFLCSFFMGLIGAWGMLGAILVLTGLSRYSLLYAFFNINTSRCDHADCH